MTEVCIIGEGRAGGSLGLALRRVGWNVTFLHRHDHVTHAASDVDMVVIATPDSVVAEVAPRITPADHCVVLHMSGALGLDVLKPHRCGSLHPLVSLPNPDVGAERLRGAWMAVAGEGFQRVAEVLGARTFPVSDKARPLYHATAAVASNHLVALMGQVERLADETGVPFEAFLALARGSLENVATLGPKDALTGPVSRGDWATVNKHLATLPDTERHLYLTLAQAAARLANQPWPTDLTGT